MLLNSIKEVEKKTTHTHMNTPIVFDDFIYENDAEITSHVLVCLKIQKVIFQFRQKYTKHIHSF